MPEPDVIAVYAAVVATAAAMVSGYQLWRQYRQRVNFVDPRIFLEGTCAVFHVRLANRSEHPIRIVEAALEWGSDKREHVADKDKGVCTPGVQIGLVESLPLKIEARDGKRFNVWIERATLADVSRVRIVLRTGANDKVRSSWLAVPDGEDAEPGAARTVTEVKGD